MKIYNVLILSFWNFLKLIQNYMYKLYRNLLTNMIVCPLIIKIPNEYVMDLLTIKNCYLAKDMLNNLSLVLPILIANSCLLIFLAYLFEVVANKVVMFSWL